MVPVHRRKGHDRKASPYEVLAGVAVRDRLLWPLVNELHAAEVRFFDRRYSAGNDELKDTKILKTKVFQHVRLNVPVDPLEVSSLAKSALDDGSKAGIREFKGLAIAKTKYVGAVFDLCERHSCRVFASVVETSAPPTTSGGLRKDYAYLFGRFFYFLQDESIQEQRSGRVAAEQGVVVFDELEQTKSHLLIDQTHRYFKETATGRQRASLIIPEPFFVHSDLTTGVQIADLAAYCISWGFRTNRMTKPPRSELAPYAEQIARLRHRADRTTASGEPLTVWSIAHITDLRTNAEKLEEVWDA